MGGVFSSTLLCSPCPENGGGRKDRLEVAAFHVPAHAGYYLARCCALLYLLYEFPAFTCTISTALFFSGYKSRCSERPRKHDTNPSARSSICGWYWTQIPGRIHICISTTSGIYLPEQSRFLGKSVLYGSNWVCLHTLLWGNQKLVKR